MRKGQLKEGSKEARKHPSRSPKRHSASAESHGGFHETIYYGTNPQKPLHPPGFLLSLYSSLHPPLLLSSSLHPPLPPLLLPLLPPLLLRLSLPLLLPLVISFDVPFPFPFLLFPSFPGSSSYLCFTPLLLARPRT